MPRLLLALACACAPLNPATLSEPCRHGYNACLNRCPKADPPPAGDTLPFPYRNQADVAACTEECNSRAKSCH